MRVREIGIDRDPKENAMKFHRNVNALLNAQLSIPDNSAKGVTSIFNCRLPGQIVSAKLTVDIQHPHIGDLQLNLLAPSGKIIQLHNRTGGRQANLSQTYQSDALRAAIGQESEGNWGLQVIDFAARDRGTLKSWRLELDLARDVPSVGFHSREVNLPINPRDGRGATVALNIPQPGRDPNVTANNMRIHIDLDRNYITDCEVKLKTPWGKTIPLNERSGWIKRGIRWTLAGANVPELANQHLGGDYMLTVNGSNTKQGGTLTRAAIEFVHESDIARVESLDTHAAASLLRSGISTRAVLNAAVPLEVSSALALHRHNNAVPLAHKLVPNRATA
jgi:subtilisin-like proprotein convertase family protein